jgi:hypothetical protein
VRCPSRFVWLSGAAPARRKIAWRKLAWITLRQSLRKWPSRSTRGIAILFSTIRFAYLQTGFGEEVLSSGSSRPTHQRPNGSTCKVRVLVNGYGRVEQVCGDGNRILRDAAEDAALKWIFRPPKLNGETIPYIQERLDFNFVLHKANGPARR